MQTAIVVDSSNRALSFDKTLAPVLEIDPGTIVVFQTDDMVMARLAGGETMRDLGADATNAVTGPVSVRGAEPGDALRIDVLDIQIKRAWSVWLPGFGRLGTRTDRMRIRQTPIEGNRVRITDGVTVPYAPMIGCIGTAPVDGVGSTMRPVFRSGGNMDLRELSLGATISLPVEVAGGLLSVGDLHAAMGRGEPTAIAFEASGSATLRIGLEKSANLPFPRLRDGADTICVGMGTSYDEAYQSAVEQAFDVLTNQFELEPFDAYAYLSSNVEMRVGGPAGSMVLAVVPDPSN